MVEFGIRVDANGLTPRTDLNGWGVGWVSIVARKVFIDKQREYLARCREDGRRVMLVYDADSLFTDWGEGWSPEFSLQAERLPSLVAKFDWYNTQLGGVADLHIIGNEPDGLGPASWQMHPRQLITLGNCARMAMPSRVLVGGGLCNGDDRWLVGYEVEYLKLFNYANIHMYGLRPTADWPDPEWGFGVLGEKVKRYQDRLPGLPIIVGEWGSQTSELGIELQSEYTYRMGAAFRDSPVAVAAFFCAGDYMVPTFGLRAEDWTRKQPLYDRFTAMVRDYQQGETLVSNRYSHQPGQHDVGQGVRDMAKQDGAQIVSCELYYPMDRDPGQQPEYSETMAVLKGRGITYRYAFDTNTVYRFQGA